MAAVKDILAQKGSEVITVGPSATVLYAALLMNEHKIGGLPVIEEGKVVGMFTERDILTRIVAAKRDPEKVNVAEVMTKLIATAPFEITIDEARRVMMERRVRHLPIIDDERHLLGLISIGDLNAHMLEAEKKANHFLQEYIYGRA